MKTVMANFILAVLFLLLLSCSSTPTQETQYFVLNPNSTKLQNNTATSENPIVLEPIQLAEFLDQPGIVLQTDTHQIQVAHYHQWAESLKHNLHRYILETLSARSNQNYLDKYPSKNTAPTRALTIAINEFNGSTDGKALLSGNWIIENNESNENVTSHSFRYESQLKTFGYPGLVNQLADLLNLLCVDIVTQTAE